MCVCVCVCAEREQAEVSYKTQQEPEKSEAQHNIMEEETEGHKANSTLKDEHVKLQMWGKDSKELETLTRRKLKGTSHM